LTQKKNKKNREFFFGGAPDAPEDHAICLFAGLLANPDMALSLHPHAQLAHWAVVTLTTVEDRCEKDHVPHETSLI
jgi:hypothetical protein